MVRFSSKQQEPAHAGRVEQRNCPEAEMWVAGPRSKSPLDSLAFSPHRLQAATCCAKKPGYNWTRGKGSHAGEMVQAVGDSSRLGLFKTSPNQHNINVKPFLIKKKKKTSAILGSGWSGPLNLS